METKPPVGHAEHPVNTGPPLRSMPIVARKAALSLDVLVAGGGVGGLAVAYMLGRAGHRVQVLEKRRMDVPSGGQRVPPNCSKILRQWVGEEELWKVATRCVGTPMHRFKSGENVGYLEWKPAVMAETGGEFLLMHHEDLVDMLRKLAVDAGASIHLDAEVKTVRPGSDEDPRPSVVLSTGKVLVADILIGADGSSSIVRDVVVEEKGLLKSAGLTVYTGTLEAADMLNDPELSTLYHADDWPIWMGEHRSLIGHPLRARRQYSIGFYRWHGPEIEPAKPNWEDIHTTNNLPTGTCAPVVQRLLKLAGQVIRTEQVSFGDGTHGWTDSTGRIVLLGEAAHPALPGGSHTASMAIEDAVVLGSLFSHLRSMDQVPSLLRAYQELRQRRCKTLVEADIGNTRLMCLPAGPAADARDESLRRKYDDWDEGMLKASFEEIAEVFAYDAGDAAEEWWVSWGRFHETAGEQPGVIVSVHQE